MKGPFDSHVRVPEAAGGLVPPCSLDVEIGDIYIGLQIVGQAVVELEVGGVLADIRVLKLESVVFIEEFEVPFSSLGHPSVIGIKGQLSLERSAEAERTGQREESQNAN